MLIGAQLSKWPFWLHFCESWTIFFKSWKILIYFTSLFLKLNNFWMCIIQNSSKKFPYLQILRFLKNSPWNLKFSCISRLSPLCMNEEKWKKSQEIKLPLQFILEQCDQFDTIIFFVSSFVETMTSPVAYNHSLT